MACDAVLEVQPLGGVRACLEIAERIGLPVVVSSALETSVGLAAAAAALPELPYAWGLATTSLLERDPVADPSVPVGGELPEGSHAVLDVSRADRALVDVGQPALQSPPIA